VTAIIVCSIEQGGQETQKQTIIACFQQALIFLPHHIRAFSNIKSRFQNLL